MERSSTTPILCLSHLRWDFVFQRPQHLMSRFAKERTVCFFEEPVWGPEATHLAVKTSPEGVIVATPYFHVPEAKGVTPDVPQGHPVNWEDVVEAQKNMLSQLISEQNLEQYVLWYYTPMALPISRHLSPTAVVYDCMDELSAFAGAPPALVRREAELLRRADVVFTGGVSLYEFKRDKHPNVHPFPSSVDVAHFGQARQPQEEPADQKEIPHLRLGFFGVIDERLDIKPLEEVAKARPDWQLVMVGPVVKIDPASLPKLPNIHYLGGKKYNELPRYLAGWDVAVIPFAKSEATRFISPTKTPEYLAAGKPVISTSIKDVVRPYEVAGLVDIADTADEFIRKVEARLAAPREKWLTEVDQLLSTMSWDLTWSRMRDQVNRAEVLHAQREQETTSMEAAI